IEQVYLPKVTGAWNLHEVCESMGLDKNLDMFVMFSSVAALLGNFGQANYSAANACLDALAEYRRARGLCAQSIQWGPWIEQGMAADLKALAEKAGLRGISNELGIRVLVEAVRNSKTVVTFLAQSFIWKRFVQRFDVVPPFFSNIEFETASPGAFRVLYSSMTPDELHTYVSNVVLDTARQVLGTSELPALDSPLQELGIDSLGAVELRNSLSQRLGVKLSATTLFDYPTIRAIIDYIVNQVSGEASAAKATSGALVSAGLAAGRNSPIAVVGYSCRLPQGSETPDKLWEMLRRAQDCVVEVPLTRFDVDMFYDSDIDAKGKMYVRKACFMDDADMFDNSFFNISAAEVTYMDPQQRVMLEVAYDAFYSAAYSREHLIGKNYGVWIGCCNSDWHFLEQQSNPDKSSSYSGPGGSGCLVSNRLSYVFGLKGPSMTIDTACSSSLVAADCGAQAMRFGYCDGALIGGVNLMLSPQLFLAFCKARMLSPDCRCATFDEKANGYVRGEGAGAIMLRHLADAQREGKRILGIVRGTAVNHDGRSASLTAPNGPAQQDVIRSALQIGGVDPLDVALVESHGTGTALGDPIEMGAIKAVYGAGRSADSPLVVGALKSYIGHLEGSSGIAGILKVLLCLRHHEVPPNLHFDTPNPHMDLSDFHVVLPKKQMKLQPAQKSSTILGSVSSFGFGGANAHVVFEEYPEPTMATDVGGERRSTEAAESAGKKRLAFLFTGQGSQYPNMCKQLYEEEPVFRSHMDACFTVLEGKLDVKLRDVIYPTAENDVEMLNLLNQTGYSQPAIFCVEYALAQLMISKGFSPSVVMGHSLGEYAAAAIAGVMDWKDALLLVHERASIMQHIDPNDGVMYACRASEQDAQAAVEKALGEKAVAVTVSAINGPRSIVLAGTQPDVLAVLKAMDMQSRAKQLTVSHAFHCPLVGEAAALLLPKVESVKLSNPNEGITFISTVTGKAVGAGELTKPEYWATHITKPVQFLQGMRAAVTSGEAGIFIEIGPRPTLVNMGQQCVPRNDYTWVAPVDPKDSNRNSFPQALEKITSNMVCTYTWKRHAFPWTVVVHPFVDKFVPDQDETKATSQKLLTPAVGELLHDHVVNGTAMMPGVGFLEAMAAGGFMMVDGKLPSTVVALRDCEFERPMLIPKIDPSTGEFTQAAKLMITVNNKDITLKSIMDGEEEEIFHSRCTFSLCPATSLPTEPADLLTSLQGRITTPVPITTLYETLQSVGLQYGARFQSIRECYAAASDEVLAKLRPKLPLHSFERNFRIHPVLLDGALQTAAVLFAEMGHKRPLVPVGVKRALLARVPAGSEVWSHVVVKSKDLRSATMDVTLFSTKGTILGQLVDVAVRAFDAVAGAQIPKGLLWEVSWVPKAKAPVEDGVDTVENEASETITPTAKLAVKPTGKVEGLARQPAVNGQPKWLLLKTPSSMLEGLQKALQGTPSAFVKELDEKHPNNAISSKIHNSEWDAIIYLGALSAAASSTTCVADALLLANTLGNTAAEKPLPNVLFVTQGQHFIRECGDVPTTAVPTQTGLYGFCRSAQLELENIIGRPVYLGTLDFAAKDPTLDDPAAFVSALQRVLAEADPTGAAGTCEPHTVIRGGKEMVPRLVKSSIECRGAVELHMSDRGALSMLKLRPMPKSARVPPPRDCVEIRVRAVGLNFRDVLNVMGLYPGDPGPPGADCAGTVVAVGEGVEHLRVGDAVFGIAQGALKTFVTTSAHLVRPLPGRLTFEQAAALPVVASTVEYALHDVAKVKKGDKVLIHAVTGGVGLAAVQFCKRVGAEIYGTCSGGKKEEFARSVGVKYITSSRDPKKFAEDMCEFLGNGKHKIDVVLNCLIENYIPETLKFLAPNGRFVELGKRGIWTREQMGTVRPDVLYETVAIDTMMEEDPVWFGGMLDRIRNLVDGSMLQPLPLHTFEMTDSSEGGVAAFRFLQRAQHIGKVVIRLSSALEVKNFTTNSRQETENEDSGERHTLSPATAVGKPLSQSVADQMHKTYIITGGTGGLGLVVAQWLIEEGAHNIVLLSRRGEPPSSVKAGDPVWKYLCGEEQPNCISVATLKCDVSQKDDLLRVFKEIESRGLPPVAGIFHAAGVTADAALASQTADSVDQVYLPKAIGAWNLHDACEALGLNKSLEVFMMFSSVAALLGNFGQANYSAANACLDALAMYRQSLGLCGQSIQWGPWIEQGMAAQLTQHLEKVGMRGITNELGLRVLGDVMMHPTVAVVGAQSLQWRKFLRRYAFEMPSFFSLVPMAGAGSSEASVNLATITKEDLCELISSLAQAVSGAAEKPAVDTPLMDLGLDSLGAVEFRNSVADKVGVKLPQNLMFENPSISSISDYILDKAAGKHGESGVTGANGGSGEGSDIPALDTPLDQWLMSVLEPAERFALYIDSFASEYGTLQKMAAEEDIITALEDLGVEDGGDFERLHVAWDDLCNQINTAKRMAAKDIRPSSTAVSVSDHPKPRMPHPMEDVDTLLASLDFDVSTLRPATAPDKVKNVLLTGVTGFVGRVQLASLMQLKQRPDLRVYCLVRARNADHALSRIREATKEAKCWQETFVSRIVPVTGDFTQPLLGLSSEEFQELARKIDIVYHTGGDVNLLSNYGRLRATNVLSVKAIIDLCTTYKVKPLHFASTLGQFPAFFAMFTGHFSGESIREDSTPDVSQMENFYPPSRQGYPWSKWAAERVLEGARKRGLPVAIYRLPNTYVAYKTGYTNKTDYATALMIASIQEGVFPIGAATAPLTPVDTICDMLVEASFLEKPKHWVYHLFDPRLVTRADLEQWSQELGISYVGVKVDEFLEAIKKRGPESPVFKFVPLMQHWRRFWFDPEERTESFPISNEHIFEDLPHMRWPSLREVFKNSLLYSVRMGFFPKNSKSIILDPQVALNEARRICGLQLMGREGEDFFLHPWRVLQESARRECDLLFGGQLAVYRTVRHYFMNVMYLADAQAKCPEIEKQEIQAPLIIVGLNRTGTTFLQNLMSTDPSNRSLRYCEMIAPYGPDGNYRPKGLPNTEESWKKDPRIPFAQEILDSQLGLSEEWMAIHTQRAELPEEDFVIFEHCGRCYSICTEFSVPSYREWLASDNYKETRKAYSFHKRFLQHLQWQRPAKRWLLKMPFHLFTLEALFETYPDAKIIFMHRDPKETMGSWASLVKHAQQSLMDNVDPSALGREELRAMSTMINRALAFRRSHPELGPRFLDVQYQDLVNNPIGVVKSIYKHFGIPLTLAAQTGIASFCNENRKHRDKLTKHMYSLKDVDLTDGMVQEAFKEYYDSGLCKYLSSAR
ncbi:putative type I fatty acid synthase, partial [Toxoplasma gondii GAB2-2007-GAL-DOM2]